MKRRRRGVWLAIGTLVVLIAAAATYAIYSIRLVLPLRNHYPAVKYSPSARKPVVTITSNRPSEWISLREISPQAVGAVLVSEDWAFYQHEGVDFRQIRESAELNWKKGRLVRGASTITQQVARNVFLHKEKTYVRKIREVILALAMERVLTKRRILEIYLNLAEWGETLYGVRAASLYYFQKNPAELRAKEGAYLAMLLPSPIRYARSSSQELTPFARETIDSILAKMVQARYLTQDEALQESLLPLPFEVSAAPVP